MRTQLFFFCLVVAIFQSSTSYSIEIVYDSSTIIGVNGIIVEGESYDVTFQDGSVTDIDILFSDAVTTEAAMTALWAQFFNPQEGYSVPFESINGFGDLDDPVDEVLVWIFTPYGEIIDENFYESFLVMEWGENVDNPTNENVSSHIIDSSIAGEFDYDQGAVFDVWAVWSKEDMENPVPTPEPATLMLFGTGIVGLAGLKRRKKK